MKQFVKALDKEKSEAYKFIQKKFPKKTDAKIKGGIFDGPEIPKLFRDDEFIKSMENKAKNAW